MEVTICRKEVLLVVNFFHLQTNFGYISHVVYKFYDHWVVKSQRKRLIDISISFKEVLEAD